MASRSTGDARLDELVSQLRKLGKHQYAKVVAAASESRGGTTARRAVAEIVNDDLQTNLMEHGLTVQCSECGSGACSKDGRRNGIQRYRCRDCGHRFTALSGTFLEKSGYMWDVWVKVVHDLIRGIAILETQQSLIDDYGCEKINTKTIWRMRMKVLYAIWSMPSPVLRGTIQMDDTFFREAQKGARELVNPLPKTANVERKPRYGVRPSLLGTLGPEFASVTCAVDNTGHCVLRSLSMGEPTSRQIVQFINEHMTDIAFLATDDDKTYRKAIRSLSLPHYICPSTRLSLLQEEGHTQLSKDSERAAVEAENNRRIKERLWNNDQLDFIEGVEAKTYYQRCQLVEAYGLSIGRVNSLHGRIDDFIKKDFHGVSTNYLPLYLALFEYKENRRADGKKSSSKTNAAEILTEAVATHAVFNGETAEEWAAGKFAPDKASGVFVTKLIDETTAVRIVTGNENFKFNKTDGFRYTSPRNLLLSLPLPTIKQMATENKIRIGNRSKSALVRELLELDDINDLIRLYAYENAAERMDKEEENLAISAAFAGLTFEEVNENRAVLSQTMPRLMFADPDEVEHPAVFVTVKTTGKNYESDEVIGFTAVDENGEILMDRTFRPVGKEVWYEKADNPAHIRPEDVFGDDDVEPIDASADEIERVLRDAKSVIGWNLHFQLDMLHACHVDIPVQHKFIDLSPALCEDDRKPNKNRRNAFDKNGQEKFAKTIYDCFGEYYSADKPLDDVQYLMRIWDAEFGDDYADVPF